MKPVKLFILSVCLLLLPKVHYSQPNGEAIFMQTCAACHTVGGGKLVGPDLLGVENRHSEDWLGKFIKSSQSLISSGDEEAIKVFNENNMIPMPDQPLSDKEIKMVLTFIKSEGSKIKEQALGVQEQSGVLTQQKTTGVNSNEEATTTEKPAITMLMLIKNPLNWLLTGLFVFLLLVIIVLSSALKSVAEYKKSA